MQQKNGIYFILDLEMTGLDPFRHGVIEFWWAILDEKFQILEELQVDICPPSDCLIDEEALAYNGFTQERIAKGVSYEEFCELFLCFLERYFPFDTKPILIWQYVTADISFLQSVFFRAGRHEIAMELWNDIIDTKSIANQENALCRLLSKPLKYTSTSLSKPGWLADTLGIRDYIAHTAMGDIDATRKVLLQFLIHN